MTELLGCVTEAVEQKAWQSPYHQRKSLKIVDGMLWREQIMQQQTVQEDR